MNRPDRRGVRRMSAAVAARTDGRRIRCAPAPTARGPGTAGRAGDRGAPRHACRAWRGSTAPARSGLTRERRPWHSPPRRSHRGGVGMTRAPVRRSASLQRGPDRRAGGSLASASMTARIPLLLDVDTGIDDSLAILYTAGSDDAELLAITCVSGNVDVDQVQRNTRAVLELAGRDDVEVAVGRPIPLVRPLEIAPETHGPKGIGYAVLPEARRPVSERFGPDVILEHARSRPGEVTLVTLGPLTNLAIALLREPELPRLLRRWVLMGGSYRSNGNTAPTTEWNIHCDPDAAKVAFTAWERSATAGVPRPLALGLDVTEKAKMLPDHLVALARRAGSKPDDTLAARAVTGSADDRSVASDPIIRYLADALRFYMEFHSRYDGFY